MPIRSERYLAGSPLRHATLQTLTFEDDDGVER
jgi:hypothetical protein